MRLCPRCMLERRRREPYVEGHVCTEPCEQPLLAGGYCDLPREVKIIRSDVDSARLLSVRNKCMGAEKHRDDRGRA